MLSPPNERGGYIRLRILSLGAVFGGFREEKKSRIAFEITKAVRAGSRNMRARPMKT